MESPRHLPVGPAAADDEWKEKSLILRGYRQSLLASNIANADTPGYQAKDINFPEALRLATTQLPAPQMTTTSQAHLGGNGAFGELSTVSFVRYASAAQPSLDNNTVDMDRQRAAFASNAVLYQFSTMVYEDELQEFKVASSDPNRR
jgi:flagellar basal-body rod protein FlgB